VVDRIFVCQKISIVANIDTVQQVSTSGSGSLTVCFVAQNVIKPCVMVHKWYPLIFIYIYLLMITVKLSALFVSIALHLKSFVF